MPTEIPDRLKRFPLWRGLPIFYTVSRDEHGDPMWKSLDSRRQMEASAKNLCHLCGQRLSVPQYWICGPLEVRDKIVSSNGPMHEECARFAIAACPFLSNPHYESRTDLSKLDGFDSPEVQKVMKEHGVEGKRVRARMALCTSEQYRTRWEKVTHLGPDGQRYYRDMPEFLIWDWVTVDYNALPNPEKPNASPHPAEN